ncbi:MAG TPA: VOC family protein [Gaiellales bacterium]|jgi:predicted enzyme related to lactoylglutathione lyase
MAELPEMRLELVPLPVDDVDASKAFYAEQAGFAVDHDIRPGNGMRVVQLTPPGSACSIVIGSGMGAPSTQGRVRNIHLVVDDISDARSALVKRGVDVGEIRDMGGVRYAHFADPDGNSWALQQIGDARTR